ncbi:hypothetical protein ACQ4WX_21515 [Streptomyces lasalocidi]
MPASRPLDSITCCAVPQDPHTPANTINAATAPIAATRPRRNADTDTWRAVVAVAGMAGIIGHTHATGQLACPP